MGMHFGVIGAKSTWPSLLGRLSQAFGTFEDRGPVTDLNRLPFGKTDDGIVAGEHGDSCFVFDRSMVLSASNYSRLLDISQQLDSLVVACVGETVSGTFGLFVADRGQLVRLYWNCEMDLSQPLQMGTPLASESVSPLEDIDGRGLFDAMRCLGLDFEAWFQQGPKQAFVWELSASNVGVLQDDGPIGKAQAEHHEKFGIPKDRQPKPTVVSRRMPDGSTGYDIVSRAVTTSSSAAAPPASAKSLLAKLRSLLKSGNAKGR